MIRILTTLRFIALIIVIVMPIMATAANTARIKISSIDFLDAKLKACINNTIFTYADEITARDCGSQSISDLTGINSLTNLDGLWLNDNKIVDVSSLATLTNLTVLSLSDNKIVDVSSLATLTNLTELRLDNNKIVDVSSLATLTNLRHLSLIGNHNIPDADIEALKIALPDCLIYRMNVFKLLEMTKDN